MLKVFIAGATGWAGSALSKAVYASSDMELVGALSRSHSGKNLAEVLNLGQGGIPIFKDINEAIEKTNFDIMVEYTSPLVAKHNIISALKQSRRVVVGTSGLTVSDYEEIESVAKDYSTSVLAVGNFSITAVLLQKFSEMAVKYVPNLEVIEYGHEDKLDAPSGTVRELVNKLSQQLKSPNIHVPDEKVIGVKETRGGTINGLKVHAIRLPSYMISVETIFALEDERLTIRHDSGRNANPYVRGAMLAIQKVSTFKGLKRGLDSVIDF
ncbi:MAG: 4-hydroxy-tetrahydrodipicolinate reductase [Solitalea-like symbiont of Acarus siro]